MKINPRKLKVSVVIPVYNEQEHLGACLASLANQTPQLTEIIVVDDGSTDRSVQIAKSYRAKVFRQSHLGPGSARNMGAKHAKHQILVFVDADMTFRYDFVAKLITPIVASGAIGTFSDEEYVNNWDNPWSRCWNWNNQNKGKARVTNRSDDQRDFRAILTTHFRRVGGFDSVGYTDSQTLSAKLSSIPTRAPGAICYHKNPSSLREVFVQARWIGKRKMKLGMIGQLINLFTHSFLLSTINGMLISLRWREMAFLIFKIYFDAGYSVGILQNILFKSTSK